MRVKFGGKFSAACGLVAVCAQTFCAAAPGEYYNNAYAISEPLAGIRAVRNSVSGVAHPKRAENFAAENSAGKRLRFFELLRSGTLAPSDFVDSGQGGAFAFCPPRPALVYSGETSCRLALCGAVRMPNFHFAFLPLIRAP